jgi:hypothetical protein
MIRDAKSSPGILTERFSALALLVFTFAITASSAYCAEVLEGAAGIDIRFEGSKMTITDPGKPEPAKLEGQVEKQQRLAAPTRLERPGKDHSIDDPSGNQQLLKLKGKYDRSPGDQKTSTSTTTLKGDVSMNVPRTPDEVAEYLKRMREILKNYESAAMSDLFQGTSRVNLKNVNIGCVQGETMDMISEIKSITPPAELKSEHYQLAGALSAIRNLVSPDSSLLTNPTGALARIGPATAH